MSTPALASLAVVAGVAGVLGVVATSIVFLVAAATWTRKASRRESLDHVIAKIAERHRNHSD